MKSVSIIIPNYNGQKLLEAYLPYVVKEKAFLKERCEVIISDDNSSDNSISFIKSHYPEIRIVEHNNNTGFSCNVNRGVNVAKNELLLILNTDVKLEENSIKYMVESFTDNKLFGVMGQILNIQDDRMQDSAKFPKWKLMDLKGTINYITKEKVDLLPTFFLSGACCMIDRKKFIEIGSLSTLFSPYYGEDFELSVRAQRMGWYCIFNKKVICRHLGSATISKEKRKKVLVISMRNKYFFHLLHHFNVHFYLYVLYLLINIPVRLLIFDLTFFRALGKLVRGFKDLRVEKKILREKIIQNSSKIESLFKLVKNFKEKTSHLTIKFF